MALDYYAANGYALELLANSPYHKNHKFGDYFRTEILPPIWLTQFRVYLDPNGLPVAMVTWAWLSEEVQTEIHETGRALVNEEWNCGDRLFFNDWISPFGDIRTYVRDFTHNVFPDEVGTSLRRNQDGTVRRVNRWTGIHLRALEGQTKA